MEVALGYEEWMSKEKMHYESQISNSKNLESESKLLVEFDEGCDSESVVSTECSRKRKFEQE